MLLTQLCVILCRVKELKLERLLYSSKGDTNRMFQHSPVGVNIKDEDDSPQDQS